MQDKQLLAAASWVLRDALGAERGHAVLVLCDEYTESVARYILRAGVDLLDLKVKIHFVPQTEQAALSRRQPRDLPKELREVIDDHSRVVVLQERKPELLTFRLDVLSYCQSLRTHRTASMPGITLDYLGLCQGEPLAIQQKNSLLADLLVRSREATLLTTSEAREEFSLKVALGENRPIVSSGVIAPGSWGNVPSGETFIVPNSGMAHGKVVIRGSIPNYPIPEGEEIRLNFEAGKVTRVAAEGYIAEHISSHLFFDITGKELYENSTRLTELGIGTNERITCFTGVPMFDEKILGTAHLGLGRSTQFGGSTHSRVHSDLVAKEPTLALDGTIVIDRGSFVLDKNDVYPNWRAIGTENISAHSHFQLGYDAYKIQRDNSSGLAALEWSSPRSQAAQLTQIGDLETASLASKLIQLIERSGKSATFKQLSAKYQQETPAILPTLQLLVWFGIVRELRR